MARIHAKRRGQSGSHKPQVTEPPEWQALSKKETKELVLKLAREGYSTARIGMTLRDAHGVPSVKLATGQRILEILAEAGIAPKLPEDLQNLIKRAIKFQEHLLERPKDLHNQRALTLVESKIRRLSDYYKAEERIPADWTYTLDTAKLLVE